MGLNKDSLSKLILLIDEIVNQDQYKWVKEELINRLLTDSQVNENSKLNDIFEYCINLIIKDHANNFYKDFKISEIKSTLINDFVRMEKFRRNDNFEDFCLAAFQQLEYIVSNLCKREELIEYLKQNRNLSPIFRFDKTTNAFYRFGNQTIGKLIFRTSNEKGEVDNNLAKNPSDWNFGSRLRAVIFFYYFNKVLKSSEDSFNKIYNLGNFLYQGRNLNHRGSDHYENQKAVIEDLTLNQHKLYFRFLGFLEDFITGINPNL